ncbi:hypothetical protein BC829DRAFT_420964 [Chytridium lagenaria]|nr:hypothetical protein BC829DRAFT_420964 [Chytridium lagenaria]
MGKITEQTSCLNLTQFINGLDGDNIINNAPDVDESTDESCQGSDELRRHQSDRRLRSEQPVNNMHSTSFGEINISRTNDADRTQSSRQPVAIPIHGPFKIKSGQISDDGTIKQTNPRRNAYFDNVAAAQASSLRNSFFRRHWEHLVQTADYMSRKINAGVMMFATYPECQAAKGYISAGFEKHVPGFDRREIKRLNDNYIVSVGGTGLQTLAAQQDSLNLVMHENNAIHRALISGFTHLRNRDNAHNSDLFQKLDLIKDMVERLEDRLNSLDRRIDQLNVNENNETSKWIVKNRAGRNAVHCVNRLDVLRGLDHQRTHQSLGAPEERYTIYRLAGPFLGCQAVGLGLHVQGSPVHL